MTNSIGSFKREMKVGSDKYRTEIFDIESETARKERYLLLYVVTKQVFRQNLSKVNTFFDFGLKTLNSIVLTLVDL